jgi:methionyl-tRNA synthetase
MSKSRGNVIDPHATIAKYGLDQMRYFLLKEGRLHLDSGLPVLLCVSM